MIYAATLGVAFSLRNYNNRMKARRDQIKIVGSSTIFPYATVVAEKFGKSGKFKTPVVESTGTGGGIKLFCVGVGVNHPDITHASRRIKMKEIKKCKNNGVNEIVEIKIGYDGIVLASSNESSNFELSSKEIFLALAEKVPNTKNEKELIPNPYNKWNEINPILPNVNIEILGPPLTSGTRDSFVELIMDRGCKSYNWLKDLKKKDKKQYKKVCRSIRVDGKYIEAGENDELIINKLKANPESIGIFGYNFLYRNSKHIKALKINNVLPTYDSISRGTYIGSRPLFFYVKKAHIGVVPGIQEYIDEFLQGMKKGEYLEKIGLVPLNDEEYNEIKKTAKILKTLDL